MNKNKKLHDQIKEVRDKLKEKDSKLKTATIELIEKEKYRCESEEKYNCIQDKFNQLEERLNEQSTVNDKYKVDAEAKDSEMNELLEKMVAKDAEIEEMQTMQESEFQGLKNLLKEKDIKLKETIANHSHQIKVR
jgi:chromosome segregation ATPase